MTNQTNISIQSSNALSTDNLAQPRNILSSINRVNRHFEHLRCNNGTLLSIQGSDTVLKIQGTVTSHCEPQRMLPCLTSYDKLSIMLMSDRSSANLESIQEFENGDIFIAVPIERVLKLIRDNN